MSIAAQGMLKCERAPLHEARTHRAAADAAVHATQLSFTVASAGIQSMQLYPFTQSQITWYIMPWPHQQHQHRQQHHQRRFIVALLQQSQQQQIQFAFVIHAQQ